MTNHGYYRHPTIFGDSITFVSEDDLWTVPAAGGLARRLTSGVGEASTPVYSPDGKWIAFIGREEGSPEVYVMPAEGGRAVRRTFLAAMLTQVVGWSRDGRSILFWSNAGQAMGKEVAIFSVDREGGLPTELPYGQAHFISFGGRSVVLGRYGTDPARWKRYRGGRTGRLWIDPNGRGKFQRLIELKGDLSRPMWIGERIYFLSDHEGIGNLYSCTPDGKALRRHTEHEEYYVRYPSTDGERIVYHAGADLYVYETAKGKSRKVEVDFRSPRTQRNRKFVDASRNLEDCALHPKGTSVALTSRGRVFSMFNWEGSALQHGEADGVRYRLAQWLSDGKRLVAVTDAGGEESLVIFTADGSAPPKHLGKLEIGRPVALTVSPKADLVALANHRYELVVVDLAKKKVRVVERSRFDRIGGLAWSPDGRWLAYSFQENVHVGGIRLCEVPTGRTHVATKAILRDVAPAFDPSGKYLYFLSYREFDPVYDSMHFELSFPRGMRPYLVTLQKDLVSPFVPRPKEEKAPAPKKKGKKDAPLRIDLEGITERVIPFPVPDGRYDQIAGIEGGALFSSLPIEGSLGQSWGPGDPEPKAMIEVYKFEDQKKETVVPGSSGFGLSMDAKTMVYRSGSRLRVLKAGEKADEKTEREAPSKKSGWLDLGRLRVAVDPGAEWRQMYHEIWRLMRDQFWVADMSGVDWKKVGDRYRPLIERVATRSEFSDVIWEMQGELGTSHCYEMGGDYRPAPRYDLGLLAAEFAYDKKKDGYRIVGITQGDPWDEDATSPLTAPGLNVKVGDVVTAINGRKLSKDRTPYEALVNLAGQEVTLTFAGGRSVNVKTLRSEGHARYREWVNQNRRWVHEHSKGRCGYVHIPDMGPAGFSEFHRQYLGEVDRGALLVDVRYNGGGHVSRLLLEKLARKPVGWNVQRHGDVEPYPSDTPLGPMVCLTNEGAGSDGDMFSHAFKLYKLGPLIGRRTWGGVVGIWPRHGMVDGSFTTQPEFSFWFRDVGYGIENYGTDPDIDVDIAPQDYAAGRDPQLEKSLEVLLDLLRKDPPKLPSFDPKPRLPLPKLPRKSAK